MCHGECACNVYITRSRFRQWRMYAYPVATFVHTRDARVRVYMSRLTRRMRALCCTQGHDNSAEKPRNICPAAINSETAPTFLANLHKTVTYHSIIRPIRPCRPFIHLTSPVPLFFCPFPVSSLSFSLSLSLYMPGGSDRVLSAVFSALCTFRNSLQIRSMSPACEGESGPFAIVLHDTAQPIAL